MNPSWHEERVPAIPDDHEGCGVGDDEECHAHSDGQHIQRHKHGETLASVAHQEEGHCQHEDSLEEDHYQTIFPQ